MSAPHPVLPLPEDADPRLVHDALFLSMHGQNAPTVVQVVWQLLHRLPRTAATHPTSAAWRAGVRALLEDTPVYVEPTRRETAAALDYLARHGLLPEWVER